MVDALHISFKVACLHWVLERADVPDVGDGVSVRSGSDLVYFVILIIQDEAIIKVVNSQ